MSTTDRKAGCGKTARPVWREGRSLYTSFLPLSHLLLHGYVFALLLFCFPFVVGTSAAADKTFLLEGNSIRLQDVSSEVEVYFQAMRFNRAAGVWDVEAILTNTGTRTLRTP